MKMRSIKTTAVVTYESDASQTRSLPPGRVYHDVPDPVAKQAVEDGTAEWWGAPQPTTGDPPAERIAAVRGAIEQLDATDDSLWSSDGKPKTAALTAELGDTVTAAERDVAFAAMQPEA